MNKLKLLELSRLDLSYFNIFILLVVNTIGQIYFSLHCCFCVPPWLLIFSELYDPYPINNRNSLKVHKAFDYQIRWSSHQVSVNFCKFSGEEGTLWFNFKTYVPSAIFQFVVQEKRTIQLLIWSSYNTQGKSGHIWHSLTQGALQSVQHT